MKKLKILILSTFISVRAFSGLHSDDADFTVKVKIIEPLSLRVEKHMEFNRLIKNGTNISEASLLLSGEPGKNYRIFLPEERGILIHSEDSVHTIPVEFEIEDLGNGTLSQGDNLIKIKGKALYTQDSSQKPGSYRGDFKVRINYD